jgi:hypothetical protein
MTVAELIAELQKYPANTRVTLQDPDTEWLLKIRLAYLTTDDVAAGPFVAITGNYGDHELE